MVGIKKKAIEGILCILPFVAIINLLKNRYNGISEIILIIEFFLFAALFMLTANQIVKKAYIYLILLFLAGSLLVTYFFFGGLGIVLVVINLIICLLVFNNLTLDESNMCAIHLSNVFAIFLAILFFKIEPNYDSYICIFFGSSVNLNTLGLLSLAALLHFAIFISNSKIRVWIKAILVVFACLFFGYYILISNCRSALIVLGIFLFMLLFNKQPIDRKKFKRIVVFILLFSLIFPFIYVRLSYKINHELVFFNKGLFSGREVVWEVVIQRILENPIFGSGNSQVILMGNGEITDSSHNTLLGIWYNLGLIPMLCVLFLFVNNLSGSLKYKIDRVSQFALVSFLFLAYFEAAFTSTYLYPFLLTFLLYKKTSKV